MREIISAMFSFKGRLNRLQYFGYNLLNMAVLIAATLLTAMIDYVIFGGDATGDVAALLAIIVIGSGLVAYFWAMLAIAVKRLHDMDLIGTHLIWIWLLGFGSGAIAASSEALGILLGLGSLGAHLWLLFAPGTVGANQYGEAP